MCVCVADMSRVGVCPPPPPDVGATFGVSELVSTEMLCLKGHLKWRIVYFKRFLCTLISVLHVV